MNEYPKQLQKGGEAKDVNTESEEAQARAAGYTDPYKFSEYPRSLYMGGTRETHPVSGNEVSADHVIVADAKEEKAARAKGYRILGETDDKK